MAQRDEWNQRFGNIAVGLLILGAAWWLLPIGWILPAAIAVFIVLSGLLPPLYGQFVSALGWFVLAAIVSKYYVYGWRIPGLFVVVGVFYLGSAIAYAVKHHRVLQSQGD